jgi:hypothetical protein
MVCVRRCGAALDWLALLGDAMGGSIARVKLKLKPTNRFERGERRATEEEHMLLQCLFCCAFLFMMMLRPQALQTCRVGYK